MSQVVLQRALAQAGVASRRAAEAMIRARRVWVNGQVVRKLGRRVDIAKDKITVDKKPLVFRNELVYYLLHKREGVVSTARDPQNRPTAVSLIPTRERIVPVGRLDVNTGGLLLLTNDGDLVYKLTHPKFEHEKEYEALIQMPHSWDRKKLEQALKKIVQGVRLAGGFKTSPGEARIISPKSNDRFWISITIHEGHKHQVRQTLNALGLSVVELKRVRLGPIELGDLPPGKWRKLTAEEIKSLKDSV